VVHTCGEFRTCQRALGEKVIAELARALADRIDNLEAANYNWSTTHEWRALCQPI
jgi:hypothetical protein